MKEIVKLTLILLTLSLWSTSIFAQGWCNYSVDEFEVVTHGTKSDNVYLLGTFEGQSTSKWVYISNSTAGRYNVSLALAAQMAGKGLSVYIDSADYDCETYPSWSTSPIRHVRIKK